MGHNPRPYSLTRDGPILTVGQAHASRRALWAFCRNCAHTEGVDTWRLVQRLRDRNLTLEAAGRRFRCKRCLNAEAVLIPAEGFAHG